MELNTDTAKKTRSDYKVPKFYLDGKNENKPQAIFLKFSFAPGKRISFFTGQRIEKNKWNSDKQRVKKNITGGAQINELLDRIEAEAKKAVSEAKYLKTELSLDKLKEVLNVVIGKQVEKTKFFELFDHFIETESKLKAWTKGTKQRFVTFRRQLLSYQESRQKAKPTYKIELPYIDDKFFQEIISFWQDKYNLRNSTLQKNIQLFKWFLNWCLTKEKVSGKFKTVKIDLKGAKSKKKIIYLDLTELGKIYRLNLPESKKYLERTKDIFIFQCLTGLRFSDLQNLKANNKSGEVLSVSTIKTGETVEIDLNETALEIWQKYSEHQAATGKAFPVPTNQVYNRFLKELAKEAELNEEVTLVHYKGAERIEETFKKHELICTHTGRRSFITNGLAKGIGSEVIREWTGHKSDKSFEAYYEIIKAKKKEDISKLAL